VSYDDGDAEWLDLSAESFKVLQAGGGPGAAAARKRRKTARVVMDSDDEDADQEEEEEGADDSGVDSDFNGKRQTIHALWRQW
jgi:hypothetical protein